MDYKEVCEKLDLSWWKIALKAVFDRDGLYEYAADKANSAVNLLLEANGATVQLIRDKLAVINAKLCKWSAYIPTPWAPTANALNQALMEVYVATEDNCVTTEEAKACIEKFKLAYSEFKAD